MYRGTDSEGNIVAIKKPHPLNGISLEKIRFRLELETILLQRTNHPNFVRHIDHNLEEEPYLVMEYVPETLLNLIQKNTVTQQVIEDYITQIPPVLQQLQKYNIAHCDLRSCNFGYIDGTIKVLDFGLAIPFNGTIFRRFPGDSSYFPPEFFLGMVLPVSDTYFAGKTLETLITGERCPTIKESIASIELYHGLKRLPDSLRKLLVGMIHPHDLKRKKPEELAELAQEAIKTLQHRKVFDFSKFVQYTIPNALDL